MLGIGYDRRIGHDFLKPGPGWGGSCFPKDTRAMLRIAEDGGYDFAFLRGVIEVNEQQFERVLGKVADAVGGDLRGAQVGVLGLTFKAGTDDLRQSPALEICRRLLERGALVCAFDPTVTTSPMEGLDVALDAYAACNRAAVVVVLTEWDEFKWLDVDKLAEVMSLRSVVDTRNLLDRGAWLRRGFTYRSVGRH
jgi:UDPglucose 6-dehydrogenase